MNTNQKGSQRMLKTLGFLCASFAVLGVASVQGQTAVSERFQEYRSRLVEYFGPLHLVPVLTPAGHDVGHVYDARSLTLLASAADCFPTLGTPTRTASSLPDIGVGPTVRGGLQISAEEIGSLEAGGRWAKATSISFKDTYVIQMSRQALRNAYSAEKCPQFKAIVEGIYAPAATSEFPLIIGAVYFAKKEMLFALDAGANAKVAVDGLSALIASLSLDLSASAYVDAENKPFIRISSDESLPVAVRPAFIPTQYRSITLSTETAPTISGATWQPFEPERPSHAEAFDRFLHSVICTEPACAGD